MTATEARTERHRRATQPPPEPTPLQRAGLMPTLILVDEVAHVLRCGVSTVWRYHEERERRDRPGYGFPAITRICGHATLDASELAAWIATQRQATQRQRGRQ